MSHVLSLSPVAAYPLAVSHTDSAEPLCGGDGAFWSEGELRETDGLLLLLCVRDNTLSFLLCSDTELSGSSL